MHTNEVDKYIEEMIMKGINLRDAVNALVNTLIRVHAHAVTRCGADEREMMSHVLAVSSRIAEVLAKYLDEVISKMQQFGLNREAIIEILRNVGSR